MSNPQIDLAYEFVSQTNKNIFLTGKAGTGKTTFLHRVKDEVNKRMAIVAPTGVAAINAEGVTIHSLFQLPFGPLVPGKTKERMAQRRFSRKKINLIKSLDLLIIDEISMVRADVLDGIDEVLRRYRYYAKPFGGLQLLMIGDLHQLPPVVKQHEWDLLREHYQTAYFFGSLALQKTQAVTIELKHIYRQADTHFIELLNKVRDNKMNDSVLKTINSRYQPDFKPADQAGYITLSSHNATAQKINTEKLKELPGKVSRFKANIDGEFPEHAYPTEVDLEFKVNAQVMFIKNDPSPEKLYYNGKIGRITKIGSEEIHVRCPDEEEVIRVAVTEWHNRKYTLNEESKEVSEEIIGTFTQYPLKLAWAITIHKSQGLTFEKVIIDAQAAFAHGQVYVALSRCKTFEGIVLRSQLIPTSVRTDAVVRHYTEDAQKNEPGEQELLQAKQEYQQGLLLELFRFKTLKYHFDQLRRILLENEKAVQGNPIADLEAIRNQAEEKVFIIARKFIPQLKHYLAQPHLPEQNEALVERLRKAGNYFVEQLKNEIQAVLEEFQILTDNKAVGKKTKEKLDDLKRELFVRIAGAKICSEGFNSTSYIRATTDAELDYQKSTAAAATRKKIVPKDIAHPELYQQLTQWRADTAESENAERYTIMPTRTLLEIVQVLPSNLASLKRINGIGKVRAERYGSEILRIVTQFAEEKQFETDLLFLATGKAPKEPKPPKPDTKLVSLELFKSGKSIAEIAEQRGLVHSTIEGHLAHFVGRNELDIFEVLDRKKIDQIKSYFETAESDALVEAKNHFQVQFSYGELKMVREYWKREVGQK